MSEESEIYHAPKANLATEQILDEDVKKVAQAQKWIIYAIFIYFLVFGFILMGMNIGLFILASILLGLIGMIKLTLNMGDSVMTIVIYSILMLIPFVGLIVLLILNARAATYLENYRYSAGLFGGIKK